MENLFFELIRLSIGTGGELSSAPASNQWRQLFAMAKKQAVAGICFEGVQKLAKGNAAMVKNLPETLLMQWLTFAANIQDRNELMDQRCSELQHELNEAGFRTSILKGQGIGSLYEPQLKQLRHPGDIDIWVDGGMAKAMRFCIEKFGRVEYDYVNAHTPFFKDVEVELHWRPFVFSNLLRNAKAQRWLETSVMKTSLTGGRAVFSHGEGIVTPTRTFNAFYLLQHCYHHMFESGLGLRQLMDYYFLLRHLTSDDRKTAYSWICKYGMRRFASAVMWIEQTVFGLEAEYLLCNPDEKEGRFILREVMAGGNFGHHDGRIRTIAKGKLQFLLANIQHNWHLVTHYPTEFFWTPVWLAYHWLWKRTGNVA